MAGLEVKISAAGLVKLETQIRAAGRKAPIAIMRAINHTGDKATTAMTRALTTQTGLKRQVIVRALKKARAAPGGSYVIRSAGGDVSLKYFGARETRSGVSAMPHGARRVFAGTFIKGALFPNRVALNKGGQVFARTGSKRLPIVVVKSGLFIPAEMVSGETAATFYAVVDAELPARLEHELGRLFE